MRDADQVDALVTEVVARHGRLDVAVNNAGGSPNTEAATASPRFTESVVRLNLWPRSTSPSGPTPQMQQQDGGGVIVNVTSLSGHAPLARHAPRTAPPRPGCSTSPTSLAMEWAPKVRVNCVSAGIVRTELFEDYYGGPEGTAAVAATIPLGRVAEPADVGNAVVVPGLAAGRVRDPAPTWWSTAAASSWRSPST